MITVKFDDKALMKSLNNVIDYSIGFKRVKVIKKLTW